jgi:hypothetical protein
LEIKPALGSIHGLRILTLARISKDVSFHQASNGEDEVCVVRIEGSFIMIVKWISVLTTCLVLQSGLIMQGQSSRQLARRDLTAYDKAGPYTIDYEPPYKGDKYLGEIRSFLWEHWKERRLGVVNATFYTIEGDPTISTSFVEPDANGCWRITVESESIISALLPKGKKPRREITQDDYDVIDRVEATGESSAPSIPVAEQELRQPQTYRLRLRNSRTNSVRIF